MEKVSLAKHSPNLVQEWSDKNDPLTPEDVSFGSHKIVWWKGPCGHEWQAVIKSRSIGRQSGCPYCSGNRVLTGYNDLVTRFPELEYEWSDRNLPLLPTEVSSQSNRKVWWSGSCGHEWQARIADRSSGHGCPYCFDHKLMIGFNDFATLHPDLAEEWSDRNGSIHPHQIPGKKVMLAWWKCKSCGAEYQSWIPSRINGSKCPYCSKRRVQAGKNDLCTTDPDLAGEWVYERNLNTLPTEVIRTSRKSYWWKCSEGHLWKAKVYDRAIRKIPCTVCESMFRSNLPVLLVALYSKRFNLKLLTNSDALTGLQTAMIIPSIRLLIDFAAEGTVLEQEHTVKRHICTSQNYQYIELPSSFDADQIISMIRMIFNKNGINITSDTQADMLCVKQEFQLLQRKNRHECEKSYMPLVI